MFSKNNFNAKQSLAIISDATRIAGNISSDGTLHIDGMVEGDIQCMSISIGKKGAVKGSIYADNIEIHGFVDGYIEAKSVTLLKTAKILGDIHHDKISIESGACVDGRCRPLNEDLANSIIEFQKKELLPKQEKNGTTE